MKSNSFVGSTFTLPIPDIFFTQIAPLLDDESKRVPAGLIARALKIWDSEEDEGSLDVDIVECKLRSVDFHA